MFSFFFIRVLAGVTTNVNRVLFPFFRRSLSPQDEDVTLDGS